jgi:hypothetical protein
MSEHVQVNANELNELLSRAIDRDVLPYHHPAWRDLEALFARLDALDDVDADLDENWLRNLRHHRHLDN